MEYKRAVEDKYIGPIIKMIMTRCIHCTRCVRFTEQIGGEYTLGTTGRGIDTEIGTYIDTLVTNELSGNAADLCPVGSLTHKPYMFKARPWELKTTYSVDVSDGLGANIEINNRGSEVMRILPRVNEEVNEEWITDKARQGFDGLKKQRLSFPMMKDENGDYKELKWEEALTIAGEAFSKVNGDEIVALIGPHADCESMVALRDLLHRLGSERIEASSTTPKLNVNMRSEYLMNSRITGIEESDFILLVGTNLRSESPVLNTRIRKAVEDNGVEVNVLGFPTDLNYDYDHIGISPSSLAEIANGTHPVSKKLAEAEFPLILVGANALSRSDGEAIMNNLKKIAIGTPVVDASKNWNGLNILHDTASKVGALDIGIPQYRGKETTKGAKLVYILGADDFRPEDIPEDAFVIYQGSHGDEGAYFADLIFPGAAFTEKLATYVNTEGRVQVGRKAVSAPVMAKEDWMIIRALSEQIGSALPYDNLEQIRDRLAELAPFMVKYDYVEPHGFEDLTLEYQPGESKMTRVPFADPIDNFYMTEAVTRNSTVMAQCTKEFNPTKLKNFRDQEYDFSGR